MAIDLEIRHEDAGSRGAFFVEREGKRLAELTYSRLGPNRVIIDHTEVSPTLQGLGIARRLLDTAVGWAGAGTVVGFAAAGAAVGAAPLAVGWPAGLAGSVGLVAGAGSPPPQAAAMTATAVPPNPRRI